MRADESRPTGVVAVFRMDRGLARPIGNAARHAQRPGHMDGLQEQGMYLLPVGTKLLSLTSILIAVAVSGVWCLGNKGDTHETEYTL